MVEVDWIKTAERPPTVEDGDRYGRVLTTLANGVAEIRHWSVVVLTPEDYPQWVCIQAVRPPKAARKLAPEWQELRKDSWEGRKEVWLFCLPKEYLVRDQRCYAGDSVTLGYTHWQPVAEPRVYADERD
jgi:hypothetical protein